MIALKEYIWYEKHRPKKFSQMTLSETNQGLLKKFVEDNNLPHCLFIGPYGSGKTTTAKILMRKIPSVHLELSGSSRDRGVNVMKGRVTDFAASMPPEGKIKIVFIDEADGMTRDAQRALKNTIEKYHGTCRFIFTTNNVGRISGAILSRCTAMTFAQFSKDDAVEYCEEILDEEDIDYKTKSVEKIVDRFHPDMRSVVNNLQAASLNGNLVLSTMPEISFNLKKLYSLIVKGEIKKIRELVAGLSYYDFIYYDMFNKFVPIQFGELLDEENDEAKFNGALIVAERLHRDSSTPDREINFTACCLELMDALKVKKIKF